MVLFLCCLMHKGDDFWPFQPGDVGFAASLLFATGTSCDPAKKPIFILMQYESSVISAACGLSCPLPSLLIP